MSIENRVNNIEAFIALMSAALSIHIEDKKEEELFMESVGAFVDCADNEGSNILSKLREVAEEIAPKG